MVWALQRYVQVEIQGPEQPFFEEETQGPPTAPGEGTNQHNEPSQATDPAIADVSDTVMLTPGQGHLTISPFMSTP